MSFGVLASSMDKSTSLIMFTISILALSIITVQSFAQIPQEKQECIIDGCNLGSPVGEPKHFNRSEYVWNLFYKMMTAAFIVGAVVQGTLIYVVFKFREKKVKK